MPKFSIIIPTHNGDVRIHNVLSSIRKQTFTDYEIIVVCDACDTDGAEIVAKEYKADKILNVDFRRDGLARNAGLDVAEGDWILFADDDDYFLHEYCFQLLAEQADKSSEDVIDFSFIWRTLGYKYQSPQEQFVMVWSRAWRLSFIGDNRFNDEPYGSDKEFYDRMIRDNPDVTIRFWNMPIYYYNYLREGSLSWMEKQKKYLDIIITHHDEPWDLGKPMFDMLENQQCVNMDNVAVTVVQDGYEGDLPWDDLLSGYTYTVNVLHCKHSGVASARNTGMNETKAQWVMFCNFDDCLSDVCSLSMYMENFPTDECDVIWSKVVQQQKWYTGVTYLNKIDAVNFSNTDGKMYRRKFLQDNNILFNQDSTYYYDYIFNMTVLAIVAPFRIMMLTTDFFPYFKRFRAASFRHTADAHTEMLASALDRDILITNEFRTRNLDYKYRTAVVKTLCRQYYAIYDPEERSKPGVPDELINFYIRNRDAFLSVSETDIEPIASEVETEVMNFIQNYYNEHRKEYYLVNDDITFADWVKKLDAYVPADTPADIVEDNPVILDTPPVTDPHVVVYCGTYDVYLNMMASAKSLLCNTPVDKVYFLIEDDTFPYDLPDSIQCINVKGQQYFPPTGPNYDNSWTWMCMIRAAYPELFPQYSKILSLDVDVVINDDVSDLWDYDISDHYLAGVPEHQRQKSSSDPLYINFGVVMMNLDKLRQDNLQPTIIDALNTNHFGCPEQDAYNKFCAGHILPLPADYNYTPYSHITSDSQRERIIHYAGQKFWRHYSAVKQYADLDWDIVMERQATLHA